VKELPSFTWEQAFGPCFFEVQAPYLTSLLIYLKKDETLIPCTVFMALPTLVELCIDNGTERMLDATALQSVTAALRHGALQRLQKVELTGYDLGAGETGDFMDALEESGCAKRLITLSLFKCGAGADGVQALADLLDGGAFPALQYLCLFQNPGITDAGVVALAEALLKPTQTFWTKLDLTNVGMGDGGMAMLTSLVCQGRLKKLKQSCLPENDGITDRSVIALAGAIDTSGLPMLERFICKRLDKVIQGVSAIALAVIKKCPHIEKIGVKNYDSTRRAGMIWLMGKWMCDNMGRMRSEEGLRMK